MFDIEEKIWELLLVLFGVLLKTALDIAREGHKKNHEKYLINITFVIICFIEFQIILTSKLFNLQFLHQGNAQND